GIGVQSSTHYFRSDAHFAWFRGGAHHNDALNPGAGGAALMVLNNGSLGIGTAAPAARLHVAGGAIRLDANQELMFAENGQIRSVDDAHRILFRRAENKLELREFGDIVLSPGATAGQETARLVVNAAGNAGIGTAAPRARLEVAGAIMPAAGGTEAAGILFPKDAFGGSGDSAWMRYYARAGEAATLELGIANDGDDHIALMPSGGVGIGVNAAADKLHVHGTVRILTDTNPIRFTSTWSGFPDGVRNQAEICNDTTGHKTLMLVGNKSNDGSTRRVSVWDRLEVNGTLYVNGVVESLTDTVMGTGAGKRFIFHSRTNGGGDFLQLTTDDAAGGWQWGQGITLRRSGNVGISTTNPQERLEVAGRIRIGTNANPIQIGGDGHTGFVNQDRRSAEISNDIDGYKTLMILGNSSSGLGRRVSVWDRLEVNGTFVNNSDARFKRNFRKLTGALRSVLRLEGLRYDLLPEGAGPAAEHQKDQIGFVAQQVREVCPELVSHDPGQDRYFLNYLGIVPLLVEAVKELRDGLEAELEAARARIAALEGAAA
ncbi:MAG TPA: tail fiber domain-containing protein, partial [Longimicrobium sp.]|nr:tail fiber domain-containing protein [Longimicrobium sp.]